MSRKRVLLGGGALLVIVLAALAWLVFSGLRARAELDTVRQQAATLRAQIAAGDLNGARETARAMTGNARHAHQLTTGPVWWLAAAVPYLGDPADTVRVSTRSMAEVATDALPHLVDASEGLSPAHLRGADGSIDLAPLERIAPALDKAARTMTSALAAVRATDSDTWLGYVNHARSQLLDEVSPLTRTIVNADVAARVVPPLLGADGPRSYLVAFQNEAELRGTGGLPGAFAIVRADAGKLSFVRFESDSYLQGTDARGLDLGRDFDDLYVVNGKSPYTTYLSSNVSPNFPYAAQIWAAMWHARTGGTIDGAMTMDPTALGYLLAVTGPARVADGTTVGADNVVALTQQQAYLRFGDNSTARRAFLLEIAKAASQQLISSGSDTTGLVRAAAQAVTEHRLLVWSSHSDVERLLATTTVGGTVPDTAAPYAGLAINNVDPSKLDYYAHVSVTRVSSGCGSTRDVTVTVTLRNDAPPTVPDYVGAHVTRYGQPDPVPTTSITSIAWFATRGASFSSVTVDGKDVGASSGRELGHPVFRIEVAVPRQTTATIVYHLREPAASGALTTRMQPMVVPVQLTLRAAHC